MGKKVRKPFRITLEAVPGLLTHSFMGVRFRFGVGRHPGALGGCGSRALDGRLPAIWLDPRLSGWQLFNCSLHEAIHACFDERMSEADVERSARDITRWMYRIYDHFPKAKKGGRER